MIVVPGQTAEGFGLVTLALTQNVDADNPEAGDLDLINHQIHFWDGSKARYQKTLCLLQFVKGEWFLNLNEGIPYFEHILKKGYKPNVVLAIFRKALLASPGAVEVLKLSLDVNKSTRVATIVWDVRFDDNKILSSADFPPFVIEGVA